MENQGKSPEMLLTEFKAKYVSSTYFSGGDVYFVGEQNAEEMTDWLLSSLSDLLRWSAEQMPNSDTRCPHARTMCDSSMSASSAIDDCKATLLRLADEICPK